MFFFIALFLVSACTSPFSHHAKFDVGNCASFSGSNIIKILTVDPENYSYVFLSDIDGTKVYLKDKVSYIDAQYSEAKCPKGL